MQRGSCMEYTPQEWDLKRRDSITGLPYPLCDCKHPKYLNDAKEMCELNKFDDVIDFLYRTVPEFAQVVSVDTKYEVFERQQHRAYMMNYMKY